MAFMSTQVYTYLLRFSPAKSGSTLIVVESKFHMEGITDFTNNVITGNGRGTVYSLQSKVMPADAYFQTIPLIGGLGWLYSAVV